MANKKDLNSLNDDEIYFYLICLKTLKNFNLYSEDELFKRLKEIYKTDTKTIEDNQEALFNFVKDKYRYGLINDLLKQVLEHLQSDKFSSFKDNFLIDNLDYLLDFISDYCIKKSQLLKQKCPNSTFLNKNLREEYIIELLKELDPSLELVQKYKWAKENKRIINLDEYGRDEAKEILAKYGLHDIDFNCCLFLDDGPLIVLANTEEIEDLANFAHEFAHFVNGRRLTPSICEYYAIFFELYAMKFLLNKNYPKEEIAYLYSERINDIVNVLLEGSIPFYYLKLYLQNKEVNENLDINFYKNFTNAKELAHKSCDKCIEQLMRKPGIIQEAYSYLMGFVLADQSLEKLNNDNILKELIDFTKNGNENILDIFNLLGFRIDNLKLSR